MLKYLTGLHLVGVGQASPGDGAQVLARSDRPETMPR